MGGQISVIKKHNNKIYSYDGWTNSLSNVTKELEFLKNPDNEFLTEYFKYADKTEGIYPIGYGIFIVDYDKKNIYTINGYSSYLGVLTSSIQMEKRRTQNTTQYDDLFNNDDLAISKDVYSGYDVIDSNYKNVSEFNFGNLTQLLGWFEYNEYKDNKKTGKSIYNRLWLDYKKYGWNYYNYKENMDGYLELFKQLYSDGIKINTNDITEWDNFFEDYYEDEPDMVSFKKLITNYFRLEKLKRINK